jgi:hypothetical protein
LLSNLRKSVRTGAPRGRRGVAMLLAIFAMVVVGSTTVAYVASRESGVLVASGARVAPEARSLAAAGMDLTMRILRYGTSNWRTNHVNGRLLNQYPLDGGFVTVDLVDIQRRDAGIPNPVPTATTTQLEVTVNSTRDGTAWTSVANMSIPSVVMGQYAIFANKILALTGTANFVGRWPHAPMSAMNYRVNMGTNALALSWNDASPWQGTGVWLQDGCSFEPAVLGAVESDPDTSKSTWVYYPNAASVVPVSGISAGLVGAKRMEAGQSSALIAPPAAPSTTGTFTNYTAAVVLNNQTVTYSQPFRIKAALLPQINTRNFEVRNNSVVTLTAGTYEIWGSWILRNSRIIIQGDVRIVVNPNLNLMGLDWRDSSIELNANSTLEIYNGYSMDMRNCWIGGRYVCAAEPDPAKRDGDPHCKQFFGQFQPNACFTTAPSSPQYIEPWRIRFYPMSQFLSSYFTWDIRDSSVVASLYLPNNPIRFQGASRVYGRVACNQLLVTDTASFYYDHALDQVTGLTEGTAPPRGGDPTQMFPVRMVRYGFDAENAR